MRRCLSIGLLFAATVATSAAAQERETIRFDLGQTGAALFGEITGHEYRDYVLGASAGQVMSVALFPEGATIPFFNVIEPGVTDGVAVYIGSSSGPHALLDLAMSGDYTIRVYNMGAARDEDGTAEFSLSVMIQ